VIDAAVSPDRVVAETEGLGGDAAPGPLTRLARRLLRLSAGRQRSASGCRGCGACCEHFGGHLRASGSDLTRWRAEGRQELLRRVNRLGWIWVDPDSSKPLARCPFLDRTGPESARCLIHDTKPEMCRAYPTLAHRRQCVRGITVH
jgi:hypothetical protein